MHREWVTRKEADAENSGGRRQERGGWDGGRQLGKVERRAGKEGSSLVERRGKEAEGRKRGNSEMNTDIFADPANAAMITLAMFSAMCMPQSFVMGWYTSCIPITIYHFNFWLSEKRNTSN
jgi:hypothetical protein